MKYVIYARRSSEDKKKQIQSIPDQFTWAHDIARERGIVVEREFSDTKTATVPGREGFTQMMKYIFAQKEPVGIITWKTDRLSRNPIDEGTIKYAFMKNTITHILSRDREYREGENQIIMGVEFGAATQYSIELSRNVKRGLKSKIVKGWQPCMAPQGYVNDPNGLKGDRKIHIDPERFPLIQRMWRLLLSDLYSVPQICKIANEEWGFRTITGKSLKVSVLYFIFKNPFYAGYIRWNGELFEGKHKPMISHAEFERAREIISRKNHPKLFRHVNTYSGLMKCGECGYSIITEPAKKKVNKGNGIVKIYNYVRCSKRSTQQKCLQKCTRQESVEAQIRSLLMSVEISPRFHEWALHELEREGLSVAEEVSPIKKQLCKRVSEIESMMVTLDEKLLSGVLSDETYRVNKSRLDGELISLKGRLNDLRADDNLFQRAVIQKLDFAKSITRSFEEGDPEEKRRLLLGLGSNLVLKDGKLDVTLNSPFRCFLSASIKSTSNFPRLEPSNIGSVTGLNGDQNEIVFNWLSTLKNVVKEMKEEFVKKGSHLHEIPKSKEEIIREEPVKFDPVKKEES